MVGALMGALLAATSPPVAAFSVSSPVSVGQTVRYANTSFDPAPGHVIVLTVWIGREASFSAPGKYAVTLDVEDDRGLWGSVTHDVLVVAPNSNLGGTTAGTGNPKTDLTCSPCVVRRGDPVTLALAAPAGAYRIVLRLPAAFRLRVRLPSGTIDYAQVNAPLWRRSGLQWLARIWVPWTGSDPPDGRYRISATLIDGKKRISAACTLTVQGTDRILVWRFARLP